MKELFISFILPTLTAFTGGGAVWFWNSRKTKLETQKAVIENEASEFDALNKSVHPLLDSIRQMSELIKTMTTEKIELQKENTRLQRENLELLDRIDTLERIVRTHDKKIKQLIKNENE